MSSAFWSQSRSFGRRTWSCPSPRRASAPPDRPRAPPPRPAPAARAAPRAAEHVRHARHVRLVAELRGHDLGVEPTPKLGRRQRHIEAGLGRAGLGLFVEEHEHRLAAGPARAHQLEHLPVAEQVVADLLDRVELPVGTVPRDDHARVAALERVEVVDVEEVAHPAIDAEQVEGGGRDEVDRRLVRAKEAADLRDPRRVVTGVPILCRIGSPVMHPLDPLSADEIRAAVAVLAREQDVEPPRWRFGMIELREPAKDALGGGDAIAREAPSAAGTATTARPTRRWSRSATTASSRGSTAGRAGQLHRGRVPRVQRGAEAGSARDRGPRAARRRRPGPRAVRHLGLRRPARAGAAPRPAGRLDRRGGHNEGGRTPTRTRSAACTSWST